MAEQTHTHAHAETAHAHEAKAPVEAKAAKPAAEAKTAEAKVAPAKGKAKEAVKNDPTPNKPAKKKGKKAVWVKKEKVKKDTKTKDVQEDLLSKWKPVFWGRFGKKHMRTRNNPKYDKWRKPRGEDMQQRRDDGAVVDVGYRGPRAIRGVHPSGYREVMVFTRKDLEMIKPMHAARISGTIGRKKKIELIKFANEKKIPVLN